MWEMEIGFGRLTKPAIEKLIFFPKVVVLIRSPRGPHAITNQ